MSSLQVDSADMNKSVNQFTYVEGDQCVSSLAALAFSRYALMHSSSSDTCL
jgi:hypothetical protein